MRGRRLTKNAPFEEEEGVRITDIELALENIEGYRWRLWGAAVYKDKEGPFTAEVGQQKIEETVYDEGLTHSVIVSLSYYDWKEGDTPRKYHE